MGTIYPAHRNKNNKTLVNTQQALMSKEYADRMCSLYLEDELEKIGYNSYQRNYRLHSKEPHTDNEVLAYSIDCPNCSNKLKQIAVNNNCYELGLYTCPACNNYKGR